MMFSLPLVVDRLVHECERRSDERIVNAIGSSGIVRIDCVKKGFGRPVIPRLRGDDRVDGVAVGARRMRAKIGKRRNEPRSCLFVCGPDVGARIGAILALLTLFAREPIPNATTPKSNSAKPEEATRVSACARAMSGSVFTTSPYVAMIGISAGCARVSSHYENMPDCSLNGRRSAASTEDNRSPRR